MGKENITNYKGSLSKFLERGMNSNKDLRPKNVNDLKLLFEEIYNNTI